jgi:metal-responsive CopG/Arc/MetJ family transcriptional regulator
MVTKVNVCLPDDVLRDLDQAAKEYHTSRSAFLVQAVKHYLEEKEEERKRQERLQAAQAILKLADEIGLWEGTAEVIKWRGKH